MQFKIQINICIPVETNTFSKKCGGIRESFIDKNLHHTAPDLFAIEMNKQLNSIFASNINETLENLWICLRKFVTDQGL